MRHDSEHLCDWCHGYSRLPQPSRHHRMNNENFRFFPPQVFFGPRCGRDPDQRFAERGVVSVLNQ